MPATLIQPGTIHEAAFRALATGLKADPDLRRVVRPTSFHDACGRPEEMAEPSAGVCPWVRLTAFGLEPRPETRTTRFEPLGVKVETAVAGPHAGAILNLWGLIESAILGSTPAARALRAALRAAGVSAIVVRKPALPADQKDYGEVTRAEGELELQIFVRTRAPHIP